jgi:hypothetical protein
MENKGIRTIKSNCDVIGIVEAINGIRYIWSWYGLSSFMGKPWTAINSLAFNYEGCIQSYRKNQTLEFSIYNPNDAN